MSEEIEFYPDTKIRTLEWGEDLIYLPNKYCPICGKRFKLYDKVVEITCLPVVKITGVPELDELELVIHLKCLLKAV